MFWQMLIPVEKQRWGHSKEPSKQLRRISIHRDARAWPNLLSQLASLERASNAKQRAWANVSFLMPCHIQREAVRSLLQLLSQGNPGCCMTAKLDVERAYGKWTDSLF